MSIKIPTGPPGGQPIDPVAEGGEPASAVAEPDVATGAESVEADAVARIAADVAAGRISGEEAVEQIIAETLGAPMVEQAPAELKAELTAALRNLIETDPHLRSLARGLGLEGD